MFRSFLSASVDRFFFGRDDTRWELVRIGAAVIVLANLILAGLSGNFERFYGHNGMLPRTEALDVIHWPGFLFLLKSDPAWIWQIYWASIVAVVCLGLGLWTRWSAAATWFLYIAMIQRNSISFNGETGILAFVLLALILAPAPQRWSLDRCLLKKPLPEAGESWAARFLQINVCSIYLFTTLFKLLGEWEIGSDDLWYRTALSDWSRIQNVEWLRSPLVSWLAVNGSLLLEGSFAFLVWFRRLRVPMVFLLILLHLSIMVLLSNSVFFFNLAAIVALCGFLKNSDRLLPPWPKRADSAPAAAADESNAA